MAVRSVSDIVECYEAGRTNILPIFRKTLPNSASLGGWYMDGGAFNPGVPAPSYYAASPRSFTPMGRAADAGWDHGFDVAPATKYLKRLTGLFFGNASSLGASFWLVDTIGFYPFIDTSIVDEEQICETVLPVPARLRDGDGVRMYIVQQFVNAGLARQQVTVRYLDNDGIERVTPQVELISDTALIWPPGTILNRGSNVIGSPNSGPWLPLATPGGRGVREVLGVTVNGVPDTALFAVVLVRMVAEMPTVHGYEGVSDPGQGRVWVEHDFGRTISRLPVIDDDAYLNFLVAQRSASAASSLSAGGEIIWR